MTPTDEGYRLSTGREFYTHGHRLSLGPDDATAMHGADGPLEFDPDPDAEDPNEPEDRFTPAERREIADFMMNLWNQWGGP